MVYEALRNEILSRRPDLPIEALDRTYAFAKEAHGAQKRYSGEPYISHPVAVAQIVLDLNPDLQTLQAALLHDVTEDTPVKRTAVEKEFGKEVADLVGGLEKLAIVKVSTDDLQEEKWKKLFLAMAKDVRIIFIKLADRLHNMRTLEYVPAHKRQRIAQESLVVHAAIASRLGMYRIKSELEDLCFCYLFPEEYKKLAEVLASHNARSEECMAYATSQVEQLLVREGVSVKKVQGRMKHLWSIYQKFEKKEIKDLDEIYDLFAVRIILPDLFREEEEQVSNVYSVLGLLHAEYIPLQDRFKDYIAVPKPNGYRSLHTTLLGLGGDIYDEPTEVQIRTLAMHREAEIGIASHWNYKLGKKGDKKIDSKVEEQLAWLRELSEEGRVKGEMELYPDRIFVLTPKRKVIELPQGANPIDFAYAVHTEVGNKMVNAKVNGRIVPFDYELRNGEVVEILTRHNAKPNRYWLSLVKTSGARTKIRNWFSKQAGDVGAAPLVKTPLHEETERRKKKVFVLPEYTEEVLITGEEKLPVILSACCKPKSPEPIIGYVTRGQFIRIHRQSCRELSGLDGERFVSAHWKEKTKRSPG